MLWANWQALVWLCVMGPFYLVFGLVALCPLVMYHKLNCLIQTCFILLVGYVLCA